MNLLMYWRKFGPRLNSFWVSKSCPSNDYRIFVLVKIVFIKLTFTLQQMSIPVIAWGGVLQCNTPESIIPQNIIVITWVMRYDIQNVERITDKLYECLLQSSACFCFSLASLYTHQNTFQKKRNNKPMNSEGRGLHAWKTA